VGLGKSDVKWKQRHFNCKRNKKADSDNILLDSLQLAIHQNVVASTSGKKVKIENSEKHE
jgi:hypothetical protein